jgi:hypothetical protein
MILYILYCIGLFFGLIFLITYYPTDANGTKDDTDAYVYEVIKWRGIKLFTIVKRIGKV